MSSTADQHSPGKALVHAAGTACASMYAQTVEDDVHCGMSYLHESCLVLIDCGGLAMVCIDRGLLHVCPQLLVVPTLRRPAHLHQHIRTRISTMELCAWL